MGQDFWSLITVETKRLLWFIGFTFVLILAFQYLQLPYGNVLVNMFYTTKIPMSRDNSSFQTAQPPSKSELFHNKTSSNSTPYSYSTENEIVPKTAFVLKPEIESNKSFGFNDSDKISVVDSVKNEGVGHNIYNITMGSYSLANTSGEENNTSKPQHINATSSTPTIVNPDKATPELSKKSNLSSVWKVSVNTSKKDESLRPLQNNVNNVLGNNSSIGSVAKENQHSDMPTPEVTSISEMNKLLLQGHPSYRSLVYDYISIFIECLFNELDHYLYRYYGIEYRLSSDVIINSVSRNHCGLQQLIKSYCRPDGRLKMHLL